MRVLTIDPGRTTGFCLADTEANNPIIEVWQKECSHDQLWDILSTTDFDVLIVEKFEFRKVDQGRAKIDYYPAELVGVCRLYGQQNPHIHTILVGSARIGSTAFWSDDNRKVRQLGLYNPKASPHGMDALRHMLYHLSFELNQTIWFERLKNV